MELGLVACASQPGSERGLEVGGSHHEGIHGRQGGRTSLLVHSPTASEESWTMMGRSWRSECAESRSRSSSQGSSRRECFCFGKVRKPIRSMKAVDATTQIVAVNCTQMLDMAHKLWFAMDEWLSLGLWRGTVESWTLREVLGRSPKATGKQASTQYNIQYMYVAEGSRQCRGGRGLRPTGFSQTLSRVGRFPPAKSHP